MYADGVQNVKKVCFVHCENIDNYEKSLMVTNAGHNHPREIDILQITIIFIIQTYNHVWQGVGACTRLSCHDATDDTQLSLSFCVAFWSCLQVGVCSCTVGYAVVCFSISWWCTCIVICQFSTMYKVKSVQLPVVLYNCISCHCDNLCTLSCMSVQHYSLVDMVRQAVKWVVYFAPITACVSKQDL